MYLYILLYDKKTYEGDIGMGKDSYGMRLGEEM